MKSFTGNNRNLPKNFQKDANWFSIFTYWYALPIFRIGSKRSLTESDLTQPLDEHRSSFLGEKLSKLWEQEWTRKKAMQKTPSLFNVLCKCFYFEITFYGFVLFLMEIGTRFLQPLFIGLLLRYFQQKHTYYHNTSDSSTYFGRIISYFSTNESLIQRGEAYFFAFGITMCTVINVLVFHPCFMGLLHLGMKMRIACCSLIYRKALMINLKEMSGQTEGIVLNLISNDVNRFDMALGLIHYLWIAPLQMLLCLYFMYRQTRVPAIMGFSILFIFLPIQAWFGHRTAVFRAKTAIKTDERIQRMNELIKGIQVIKMYAWEYAFSNLIYQQRREEIDVLKKCGLVRGMMMSFILFTTRTTIFVTIIAHMFYYETITPEDVFVLISFYQIMRQTMTLYFPQGIAQVAELKVAIARIKQFLIMDETIVKESQFNYDNEDDQLINDGAIISIRNITAKFNDDICLDKINFDVKPSQLTAIIGHVGSGKSCLLNLILGELQPIDGDVNVKGCISYAAQQPWLFAGTVQQNILFGHHYERIHYQTVVRICSLQRDFQLLPHGDQTIVGDRGIALSGGQRARINLARCIYKQADIYLLDDPLSAVDTEVSRDLFDNCIKQYLNDKIVILVTHQLQYLQYFKQIIIMDQGVIQMIGDYNDLQKSQLDFATFLKHQLQLDEREQRLKEISKLAHIVRHLSIASSLGLGAISKETERFTVPKIAEFQAVTPLKQNTYREFSDTYGRPWMIYFVIALFIGAQFCATGVDYTISLWISYGQHYPVDEFNYYLFIYTMFVVSTAIISVLRSWLFFTICMDASMKLHNRMFDSVMNATMEFFNTNTAGMILNRFSKDLGAVDDFLPIAMIDTIQLMLNLIGSIVIVGLVNYYLLIPTIVICLLFYIMRKYYLKTSRSVKLLDGITKSPILGHVTATMQGLTTIRSNGAQLRLIEEFDNLQDLHSSAWFMFLATSKAFSFWVDTVCVIYIGFITFSFMIYESTSTNVGMVITQCIGLSGLFQWGLRQSAELENQMTSVERVLEYTKIPQEPPLEFDQKPPPSWPSVGRIEFRNLTMFYNKDKSPVLRNVSFIIQSQEKVGIVGRTGAGKSSLILSLFRLEDFDGQVLIDDIDTKTIGLHDVRKHLSIIPQEPILFSGTMRYNLDPFNEHNDEALIDVLRTGNVRPTLTLDSYVYEGGANISVGEKQMICLARAILKNNKILVLDEATANIDPETDQFIQTIIRTKFEHCTVLTIAHRLHTIMDSDRVLVMEAGSAVEFDHPHILLQNRDGIFNKMVTNTGTQMALNLRNIAKEQYERKYGRR